MSFFQTASRYLVVVPVLLMMYIILILQREPSGTLDIGRPSLTPTTQPLPTPLPEHFPDADEGLRSLFRGVSEDFPGTALTGVPLVGSAVALDLKGPWQCTYTSPDGRTTELYIKDRTVKISLDRGSITEQVLVQGDCLYEWQSNSAGTKQCGITQYLDLIEALTASGTLDLSALAKEQLASQTTDMADISLVLSTCTQKDFGGQIFTIPQGIKWSETAAY